jgi:NADH-quinone oxidoreductase subunit N
MLTGLAAGSSMGNTGIAFYVTSYLFMNIGAFGILGYLEEVPERNLSYDDYAGLGSRRPLLAALMSLFMFSLAGIPPFGGFIGKYYMFAAAVRSGLTWLAVVGVLTSVVSVYYYLRLVVVMYFRDAAGRDAAGPEGAGRDIPSMAAILAVALATLLLGVYPSPLLEVIRSLF